ncbi:hypothetical protein SAMN04489761_3015 [Tenacibaculum sp. MAR_2009_124]|uniref:hypothetical protein n=1 Tax=Tenacibaculum sp. MAR_2009_124 TaxID=1250059 RepID=UPI00089BFCA4|nr:hypothetical protein [Tenacibaculum sp. MAR_2009_124]SEC44649.1 hypothetical protein SAMN04489761_3015 [Tenacibaculum sp. MAR_2009_124]
MNHSISIEETQKFVNYLNEAGLMVVEKKALNDMFRKISLESQVDKRHKLLTRKQLKEKHGVSRRWLDKQLNDPNTLIKYDPGTSRTSTQKFNEQSILDERARLMI